MLIHFCVIFLIKGTGVAQSYISILLRLAVTCYGDYNSHKRLRSMKTPRSPFSFPFHISSAGALALALALDLHRRRIMSALLRGLARIRSAPALRGTGITQRANITTKPPKDAVGLTVSLLWGFYWVARARAFFPCYRWLC